MVASRKLYETVNGNSFGIQKVDASEDALASANSGSRSACLQVLVVNVISAATLPRVVNAAVLLNDVVPDMCTVRCACLPS